MEETYVDLDNDLREELVALSLKGEIKHSEKYLKKAGQATLEKIKQNYDIVVQDRVNTLLTETLINKFSTIMEQLKLVKDDEKLDGELSANKLFCDDLKYMVDKIAPYIPMIGLLTGCLIVAKHVWNCDNKDVRKNSGGNVKNSDGVNVDDPINSGANIN